MPILKPHIKKQILIAACVDVAHIMIGYTMSWSAPVVPKLQDPYKTPLDSVMSVSQVSWVASCCAIFAIFGPYIGGPISNKVGRKYSLVFGESLMILGTLLLIFANSYWIILTARLLAGLSVGMIAVTDLVYIGEIASPNIRGMLLTSTGVFHSLGVLFMYSVGPFASYKTIGIISIILSLVHLLSCVFFLPESQIYYAIKGKKDEARTVLGDIRRKHDVDTELENIMCESKKNEENATSYKDIFTVRSNRRALFILVALFMFQENSGFFAIQHYSTTIFQIAQSSVDPNLATIAIGITQFTATLAAPCLIDRIGRKTLLLCSTAGSSVCMVLLAVYFYLADHKYNMSSVGWLPLVLVVLFYCSYGSGLSIIPNSIAGEMFSARVRTRGSTLSLTMGWSSAVISITCFGYVVEAVGIYVIFLMFTFINCFGFMFIYFVVPETKGMTLIEIERMLAQ